MSVITISGNLGSGGRLGQIVALRLGIDYMDNDVLTEAAHALRMGGRSVVGPDEESPASTLRERLVSIFREFLEHSAVAGVAGPLSGIDGLEALMATSYGEAALPGAGEREVSCSRYKEAITSVMTELAARSDVVIIGRGGQTILRENPRCLHVRITAPLAVRVSRIAEREGLSAEKAKERVEESDKARLDYHRKYFKVDPADPDLYDIVINMTHISEENAAELIAAAVRAKTSSGHPSNL